MTFKDKRLLWILFGISTILFRVLLKGNPEWVEQWYSRGFFQLIRFVSDWTIGWLPFPVLYLMVLVLPVWLVWKLIKKMRKVAGWKSKVYQLVISLLAFAGGVVGLFLCLWGFNYLRIPIEGQLQMDLKPLSTLQLKEELDFFTPKIITARRMVLHADNQSLADDFLPVDLNTLVQDEVAKKMVELGYPVHRKLPVRTLFEGSLLRIGTAGFYLPFTGECNIDAGLHALQKPYVLAHEMAHGIGIGDEGSCNFIAYLSCVNSNNAFVKYSGYLSFWRTLAVNYRSQAPEEYKAFRAELPPGIIADLDAINANSLSYPDIFPELRDRTYDAFLRTQGIAEGMLNYNRVIVLVRAYRMQRQEMEHLKMEELSPKKDF